MLETSIARSQGRSQDSGSQVWPLDHHHLELVRELVRNLLEMQILVLFPRPAESETLGMGFSNLATGDSDVHSTLAGNVKSIAQNLRLLKCLVFPSEFQDLWRGYHLPAPLEIPEEK